MNVGQYCKRAVISINTKADVAEAARSMRDNHVGFLVAVNEGDEFKRPVGVLTDRDILLEVTACDVDAHGVTVGDVMARNPLVANESDDLSDLIQAMRSAGFRRLPVVDTRGQLTGIIAMDDVIDVMAGLICDLAGSIKNEQRQERRVR